MRFGLTGTSFFKFVAQNYQMPAGFSGQSKIFVQFVVERDGSLSNYKILRDAGSGTGEEAIRVLSLSPKWTPGKMGDLTVRTLYSLPISLVQKK